jgi:hypothetical protein
MGQLPKIDWRRRGPKNTQTSNSNFQANFQEKFYWRTESNGCEITEKICTKLVGSESTGRIERNGATDNSVKGEQQNRKRGGAGKNPARMLKAWGKKPAHY